MKTIQTILKIEGNLEKLWRRSLFIPHKQGLQKNAEWIAEKMGEETMELREAKKKSDDYFASFDAIVYGGWIMAGTIKKSEWFTNRIQKWRGKNWFCLE